MTALGDGMNVISVGPVSECSPTIRERMITRQQECYSLRVRSGFIQDRFYPGFFSFLPFFPEPSVFVCSCGGFCFWFEFSDLCFALEDVSMDIVEQIF